MLNLRSVYTTTVGSSSYYDPDKTMSNVNFAHSSGIVGNLGAPLKDYSFMYDDDDEEEAVYVRADPLLVGLDTPSTDITTDTERTKADDLYADDMSVIDIKADYYYGQCVPCQLHLSRCKMLTSVLPPTVFDIVSHSLDIVLVSWDLFVYVGITGVLMYIIHVGHPVTTLVCL